MQKTGENIDENTTEIMEYYTLGMAFFTLFNIGLYKNGAEMAYCEEKSVSLHLK